MVNVTTNFAPVPLAVTAYSFSLQLTDALCVPSLLPREWEAVWPKGILETLTNGGTKTKTTGDVNASSKYQQTRSV